MQLDFNIVGLGHRKLDCLHASGEGHDQMMARLPF